MKKLFLKLWCKVKKIVTFFLNWRFALSFGLAWMITNGWAYLALGIGMYLKIDWLTAIAASYTAILYLPFTAEKLITIPLAILICKIIFPKQKQIRDDLNQLLEEEKNKFKRSKKNARFDNNAKDERKSDS